MPIEIKKNIDSCLVKISTSISNTMAVIANNLMGGVFVIDDSHHLVGSVTDGDIRRGLLKGMTIHDAVENVMCSKPISVPLGTRKRDILSVMNIYQVKHIPIIDANRIVHEIYYFDDLVKDIELKPIPLSVPDITGLEVEYIRQCVESTWISTAGDNIRRFEEELGQFFNVPHIIAVNSGTSALHAALLSVPVGPGDEVIVPGLSFIATANVVVYCGAQPVFCDIHPRTWTIDPDEIEACITPKTKAVMVVHLMGNPADMDPIKKICKSYHIALIEDAAQGFGATVSGKMCGTIGDSGCLSFNGNKSITTGGGGAVLTHNDELASRVRMLTDQGRNPGNHRYIHQVVGFNYRMTNIHAAIGLAQLKRSQQLLEQRKQVHLLYKEQLAGLPGVIFQESYPGALPLCWLTAVKIDPFLFGIDATTINDQLNRNHIYSSLMYPVIPDQPAYRDYVPMYISRLENCRHIAANTLLLPSSYGLTREEVLFITNTIKSIHLWARGKK